MTPSLEIDDNEKNQETLLSRFFSDFSYFSPDEKNEIERAWTFTLDKSPKSADNGRQPYYLHAMRVAVILAESSLDAQCICAGFLHNILSFETVTLKEVESAFGKEIASIINGTARITSLRIHNKTLQQADSVRKMLFAMIDDIRVILVKLADRLDRMRYIKYEDTEIQKSTAMEVIDIWAPLANRLGMSSVKSELEDLSLKVTNPDVFQHIKQIVALKKGERNEYLDRVQKEIQKASSKAGISITLSARAKHFYSIYQKMRKRNKAAEDLYDLLALRIICSSNTECYTLVGIVHNLWKPLEGRFKDYIAMPKANGYQSLHTTVMFEGKPLEIQIRTEQMHSVAEHGVASHWLYKKGTNRDAVSIENLSIINQLKELRKEHLSDEEFFNEIKEELLGDSIFVFTPQGDVRELPSGSTAIDFAYTIHSHIGEKIVGAKADGHIIPLSSPLKNTQIIEILTNPQAHPTMNQLHIVKTAKARSKIKSWLLEHDPAMIASAEAKAAEKAAAQALQVLQNSGVQTGRTATHSKNSQHTDTDENRDAFTAGGSQAAEISSGASSAGRTAVHQPMSASNKIRIGDTSNFLVTIARCCSPVYGDDIVGYISRGRGLTVHRADCRNFSRIPNVNERMIEVIWEPPNSPQEQARRHKK